MLHIICENKGADQPHGNLLSHLLWLYSTVCVRPGPIPQDRFCPVAAQFQFKNDVRSNIDAFYHYKFKLF